MDLKLVHFIASKFAAHDSEQGGQPKPEDFYLDLAAVAVKAYEEHEWRPREKPDYLEGIGAYHF